MIERVANALEDLARKSNRNSSYCFWCYKSISFDAHPDCLEEFKQAIQSLAGGRKLNKSESIKMRSSKR